MWERPAKKIQALVRAASDPYPGAYTFAEGRKLIVWRADVEPELPYRGVPGRIVHHDAARGWLVQTGDGLLWLTKAEFAPEAGGGPPPKLRIGMLLGADAADEMYILKKRVKELEARIDLLEKSKTLSRKNP